MNDFEKKLQAIRLNPARHGPKLVSEALDMLMLTKWAAEVRKAKHPVWANIEKTMKPLRPAAQGTELSAQYLDKLFRLIDEKRLYEQQIASMVPFNQRKKAALFSNYTEGRFRSLLSRLIGHSRLSDTFKNMLEARLYRHSGLFEAIKELSRFDSESYNYSGKATHLKRMDLFNAVGIDM